MEMTPAGLRARFRELSAMREERQGASCPLRAERDALIADTQARVAQLDEAIAAAEAGMFEIDQEASLIVRALGGRTGEPDVT